MQLASMPSLQLKHMRQTEPLLPSSYSTIYSRVWEFARHCSAITCKLSRAHSTTLINSSRLSRNRADKRNLKCAAILPKSRPLHRDHRARSTSSSPSFRDELQDCFAEQLVSSCCAGALLS